jgi:hypothetical protein
MINPQACTPLSITSPGTLSGGTVSQGYTYQITTSGGQAPVSFSVVSGSLPVGLNLSGTGLISGMPTTAGSYNFTVRATDSCPAGAQNAEQAFTITINPQACAPLSITSPGTLSGGTVNQGYTYQITTSGGQAPVSFSVVSGSLPVGLNLSGTGLISGMPTTAGSYNFTVRATDSCPAGAQNADRIFSLTIQPAPVLINVVTTPGSVSVPRGRSSVYSVSYIFTSGREVNVSLNSSAADFMVNGETIGTNAAPLTAIISNGHGTISETVNIPVRVIESAIRKGSNSFIYSRVFQSSAGEFVLMAVVDFAITTEAGAAFQIQRLDLYFENRRPEITIPRNYPNLRAYADIRFVGSGLLQGFWEVDGRIINRVDRHLLFGSSITVETPEIPPLPTFDNGYHSVRFVITNPVADITLPTILYFVTAGEFYWKPISITLYAPENNDSPEYGPVTFSWEKINNADFFQIDFVEDPDSQTVFSAQTKSGSYDIPEMVLQKYFIRGGKYYWKVTGYNSEGIVIGESQSRSFSFKKPLDYVKGQIIVVFEEDKFSDGLVKRLQETHALTHIRTHDLRSLNLKTVIFGTNEEDIFRVIGEIGKNREVLLVQPNYLFRTMSDPLCQSQYANDMLKIDRLHERAKGRGIKIAVVDTGVDADHDDLIDRISAKKNFVESEPYLPEIHGTAVAGVIAASVNGFGMVGVAPEAGLIALRACRQISAENPGGECSTDSLVRALDEALLQRAHIVNMSFGTPHYDSLLARLIERGKETGVLFVAPAGNMINDRKLRFPASHPAVIAVGGLDEQMNPYPNSDIAKSCCVCAPALNILTTVPGNKHNFISGTSLSSAYITGILALALEKDKSITRENLPAYEGDICRWQEKLMKMKLCEE